jgi:CubicO group peptidase (beta-lactamase class C family)
VPALRDVAFARTGAPPLSADTPSRTPAGVTFTAPAGWRLVGGERSVTLTPPEADSSIVVVDVKAASADEAVALAWTAYKADAKPPLRISVPGVARDGWEERRAYQYETSPNEKKTVFASASRAGDTWNVIIVDASDATFGKRASQASLVLSSVRPAGYQRETFAGRTAHPLTPERIAVLKDFIADGMRQLGVPGVAIGLIDGGRIVFEGGLGVKELGKREAVDADTLFIAASNTKAMTTLLLATLVDAGKLRWDQPVVEVDPSFKLGDAETTRQVLVKHLVCACTGMPRQDMEWLFEYSKSSPAAAMRSLGGMQPTSKFGEVFQYSNLMAAAAGYVGAKVIAPGREPGAAYDEAMRTRIFGPAGMRNTTFDFARVLRGNYAKPHGLDVDGNLAPARMDLNYSIVPVRPAGGVWTSAHDFLRYVQLELARGRLPDGKQIVSPENVLARMAPQVLVSEDIHYGMALFVDRRWGVTVIRHGGDLAGYHSDMMWLPDHNVGAVILTNSDPGVSLRGPFLRRLVEVMFDGKPEAAEQVRIAALQRKTVIAKERERLVVPADPAKSRSWRRATRAQSLVP